MAPLTAIYQTGRQTYVSQAWANIRYSIEFLNTSPGHCVAIRAKNFHFYMFALSEIKMFFFIKFGPFSSDLSLFKIPWPPTL